MSEVPSVLLLAKPPASDHLTYLTLLEYNLTKDNVFELEEILAKDHDLAKNIGWDLVAILLPLLPQSQTCLDLVAGLGNPREVILKVQEALYNKANSDDQDENDGTIEVDEPTDEVNDGRSDVAILIEDDEGSDDFDLVDRDEFIPAPDAGFNTRFPSLDLRSVTTLLNMLTVLHSRIRTTYPTKFLSTSVDAILSAFTHLQPGPDNDCMRALLKFALSFSAKQRPVLPSRDSRANLPSQMRRPSISKAPDPEAQDVENADEENARVKNALEDLMIRSASIYLRSLPPRHGDSHFAWTTRFNLDDERRYLPLPTDVQLHEYKDADDIIQQIFTILEKDVRSEWVKRHASGAEMLVYRSQDLLLVAAKVFAYRNNLDNLPLKLPTMHEHAQICHNYVHESNNLMIVDAITLLGYSQIDHFSYQECCEEEKWFPQYMHNLTLITLNTSQPRLRAQVAQYSKAVFDLQPSSNARFLYLIDCFKDCPFDNIKVETLSWLKDSILYAFNLKPRLRCARLKITEDYDTFKNPLTLKQILKVITYLYDMYNSSDLVSKVDLPSTSFTLTLTNLLYLLVSQPEISVTLNVLGTIESLDLMDRIALFQSQLGGLDASILQNSLQLLVDAMFDAGVRREKRLVEEREERERLRKEKEDKERMERAQNERDLNMSPRSRNRNDC